MHLQECFWVCCERGDRLVLGVGAERAHNLACAPDLLVVDLLELPGEVLAVRSAAVPLEGLAGLGAVLHALVELLEDRDVGLLEYRGPVERATASSGGASVVHVVHAIERS